MHMFLMSLAQEDGVSSKAEMKALAWETQIQVEMAAVCGTTCQIS